MKILLIYFNVIIKFIYFIIKMNEGYFWCVNIDIKLKFFNEKEFNSSTSKLKKNEKIMKKILII